MINFLVTGVQVNSVTVRAILLDMSVDAPARSIWQCIKQFNGYCGCGRCKETGQHLDLGPGKKNSRRSCHVIPLTKLLLAQQDTQDYETMMKSKNRLLRHQSKRVEAKKCKLYSTD